MKIVDIQYLIKKYGEKTTLKEALEKEQGDYIYVCPKCAGKGIIKEKKYIDRGYYNEEIIGKIKCDLCNGIGYTREEYKIKYKKIIDRYYKEETNANRRI